MQLELFVCFFAISYLSFYAYCYQDVLKLDDLSWLQCQDIKISMDFKCLSCAITNLREGTPSRSHFTLSLFNVFFQAS